MGLEDDIKSKFRNEFQKLRLNIHYTNNFLRSNMEEVMKQKGITAQQYNILRILRGQETKMACVGLIKERMLDKNSDVSRLLDRLLSKEFIERKESKQDRRQKDVKITKLGLQLVDSMDDLDVQMDAQFSNITTEEALQLNTLLDKIRN